MVKVINIKVIHFSVLFFGVALRCFPQLSLASIDSSAVPTPLAKRSFAGFPLWKDVPAKSFAVLGRGVVHGTRWEAFVFRSAGRGMVKGSSLPCVDVARITEFGNYSYSIECGFLAPELGIDVMPVYALLSSSSTGLPTREGSGESFLVMSLAPSVRRVEILGTGGSTIDREARYLSRRQSEKAKVKPFRYVTSAVARALCVQGVVGFDNSGTKILDAHGHECQRSSR